MRTPLCARPYAAVVARAAWGRGASQGSQEQSGLTSCGAVPGRPICHSGPGTGQACNLTWSTCPVVDALGATSQSVEPCYSLGPGPCPPPVPPGLLAIDLVTAIEWPSFGSAHRDRACSVRLRVGAGPGSVPRSWVTWARCLISSHSLASSRLVSQARAPTCSNRRESSLRSRPTCPCRHGAARHSQCAYVGSRWSKLGEEA